MSSIFFKKYKVLLLFFLINTDIKCKCVDQFHIFSYTTTRKLILPGVNYNFSFKYLDLFAGCGIGFQPYIISKNKFKIGIIGARIDILTYIFDIILNACDAKINKLISINTEPNSVNDGLIGNLLRNLTITPMTLKLGPLNIYFLELKVEDIASVVVSSHDNYKKNNINEFFYINLFLPSISLDITQLLFNIKNNKNFLNICY